MEKIRQPSHYVYIVEQESKSSHDMSINFILKDKLNIIQEFQHAVKIKVITK